MDPHLQAQLSLELLANVHDSVVLCLWRQVEYTHNFLKDSLRIAFELVETSFWTALGTQYA